MALEGLGKRTESCVSLHPINTPFPVRTRSPAERKTERHTKEVQYKKQNMIIKTRRYINFGKEN